MPRLALLVFPLVLLTACSAPPPYELPPPPDGQVGPPLRIEAVELGYVPTPDRPRYATGNKADTYQTLYCVACEEPLPRTFDREQPLPSCAECEAKTTWITGFVRPYRPRLDGTATATEVARLLSKRGSFAGAAGPADPAPAQADATWRKLSVELKRAELKLIDTHWVPLKVVTAVACWILIFPGLDFPNWFLPGEEYGIEQRAAWRLSDAAGKVLAQGEVETTTTDTFAAFGPGATRPWFIVGFVRVPGCLDEEDWGVISSQLQTRAQVDLARALVKSVEANREATR